MAAVRIALVALYTLALGTLAIGVTLVGGGPRLFQPIARLWSRLVLWTCCVRWTAVRELPALPSGCVFIANHQSLLDIPALVLAVPGKVRFVAKRELLRVPVFGWALWLAGFVFVDRANRERAIRSLEAAAERLRRGLSIVVFAEGTRSPDGRLLPFKKGGFMLALHAGAPVVPVAISGGHRVLPKGRLRVRPGLIAIRFGRPVDTGEYSVDNRDALIERVRRAIVRGLETGAGSADRAAGI